MGVPTGLAQDLGSSRAWETGDTDPQSAFKPHAGQESWVLGQRGVCSEGVCWVVGWGQQGMRQLGWWDRDEETHPARQLEAVCGAGNRCGRQ